MDDEERPEDDRPEDETEKTSEDAKAPAWIWAERKGLTAGPDNWKFPAASANKGWLPDQLVTEAEFDQALEDQGKPVSR